MTSTVTSQRMAPPEAAQDIPALRITSLSKRFRLPRSPLDWLRRKPVRRVSALSGVTVDIVAGEVFGILGPNGAGKTTLFKIISTLISPDEGCVAVNGLDVGSNPALARRNVTPVIADERSLRWRLPARANLELFARLYGCPPGMVATRVDEVLEAVELDPSDGRMVGAFSAGMKQRLALARALLARPSVLLLDEPTRSLDPVAARRFRQFLRERIVRDRRTTVVLATHDAEEAFDVCDRVGILHQGRLLTHERGATLREAYADNRYRAWLAGSADIDSARLPKAVVVPGSVRQVDESTVTVDLSLDRTADPSAVLAGLVYAGIPIARFERVALSLADLIERVVADRGGTSHG